MIDYNKALYRRNNHGNTCVWYGRLDDNKTIQIFYGVLGKSINTEFIRSGNRKSKDELQSRINTKLKSGYLYLSDVTDQNILPVEEDAIKDYLDTYLPYDRQSSTGAMLPMLAKIYDNSNNKMFKNGKSYISQPKLNGLRCEIGATKVGVDMFNPVRLTFQSREGTYWDSLSDIEQYLISIIPIDLIDKMLNEGYLLDGEMYLYGETVNEINSCVKNPKHPKHAFLQFWCYDIAVPEMSQILRLDLLDNHFPDYKFNINSKEDHEELDDRFVIVPCYECNSNVSAISLRNMFIDWGFEGEILRDKQAEYQFGKRNSAMWKYKATVDGIFAIIDIESEGDARPDIPLLILKNDINDSIFKVHITGSFEFQKDILKNKYEYIYRKVIVEYGERSGVEQVPFHVKTVTLVIDPVEGKYNN